MYAVDSFCLGQKGKRQDIFETMITKTQSNSLRYVDRQVDRYIVSLPELMDFKLFGKTILVVNKKFRLFLASQPGK